MLYIEATNLPLVMNCNGSRDMPAAYPHVDDPTARDEGTAAHWLAQQWFNGAAPEVGAKAPNGYIITADMFEHVATYLSALIAGTMEIETTFTDGLHWQVNARADHIVCLSHPNDQYQTPAELIVDDFKYGWRLVEPEMNWTLIAHAIGYCARNRVTPPTIRLRIHQPRPHHSDGPLREWIIGYERLMELYAQIHQTLTNPSNTLQSGKHCFNCHAFTNCPAAHDMRMNSLQMTTRVFTDELTDAELNNELSIIGDAKAALEASYDALKELALHRLQSGRVLADYGLEPQMAQTRFKPGLTAATLTMLTGIDCSKPGTITPAEFKRRGGSEASYKSLTERPMIGQKLVRMSADRRARRAGLGVS